MENKLEYFTEGSEWFMGETKFKFSHFDPEDGIPLFTCEDPGLLFPEPDGTYGFLFSWKYFTKVEQE